MIILPATETFFGFDSFKGDQEAIITQSDGRT
jgi:hypothetical protein